VHLAIGTKHFGDFLGEREISALKRVSRLVWLYLVRGRVS
jgi:hypothetical protein